MKMAQKKPFSISEICLIHFLQLARTPNGVTKIIRGFHHDRDLVPFREKTQRAYS